MKVFFKNNWWKIIDKNQRFLFLSSKGFLDHLSDKAYLERLCLARMGKPLNIDNPKTFNEKLQWLKLHDRRPEYTMMVDKYAVRKYIADIIGEEYLIPLYGVWNNPEEIDFNELPNQFVLKCTHNSGVGLCICKDKSTLDIEKVKKELRKGLKQDYYLAGREWPYKNVPRKIIAEKYLTDYDGAPSLTDYKFFCFDGKVDSVMVAHERHTGDPKFYFFDRQWQLLRLNVRGQNAPPDFTLPKPKCIDEMFKIAGILSKGIPFVRVDLYQSNDKVYFGEMTFFPQSGFDANLLPETDLYFGGLIKIEEAK